MRLTLRTLLAYLDNTLEPADAEVIRTKLAESGFATQLVQRIRRNLVAPQINALPPEAMGPVQDPNTIAEYLDSTLPDEQVAEIEKACLESDVHLAEAAACHQILTMVLGRPANVPPELRDRIYEMPDREIGKIAATSQRFSSLSIDPPPSNPAMDGVVDAHGDAVGTQPSASSSPGPVSGQAVVPSDSEVLGGMSSAMSGQAGGAASSLTGADGPVTPVGRTDSGVSDAPTRLRESGVLDPEDVGVYPSDPAIAGSRPLSREEEVYGGTIRPSRITPWLVSLALAGALLFAFVKVFQPVIGDKTATETTMNDSPLPGVPDVDRPAINTPNDVPIVEIDPPAGQPDPLDAERSADVVDELPIPDNATDMLPTPGGIDASTAAENNNDSAADSAAIASPGDTEAGPSGADLPGPMDAATGEPDSTSVASVADPNIGDRISNEIEPGELMAPEPDAPNSAAEGSADDASPEVVAGDAEMAEMSERNVADLPSNAQEPDIAPTEPPKIAAATPSSSKDGEAEMEAAPKPDAEVASAAEMQPDSKIAAKIPSAEDVMKPAPQPVVATVDAANSLVMTLLENGQWKRLKKMGEVKMLAPVVCAPTFRARMLPIAVDGESAYEVTMAGPTGLRWLPVTYDEGDNPSAVKPTPGLEVNSGNVVIASKKPDVTMPLKLGGQALDLKFDGEETVIAAFTRYSRLPGKDPFDPKSRIELVGIMCVQGSVEIEHNEKKETISTGSGWLKRSGEDEAVVSPDATTPSWVDAPDPDDATSGAKSLGAKTREFLLELTNEDKPIELLLREARLFRRPEVAALSAQALLQIGQADVYFGADGVLSQSRQRQYWPGHYRALVTALDSGPETAEWVVRGMEKMDGANSPDLLKLLEGYSQQELADGGDKELVEYLDSESMAVRVLAVESLRDITGDTLYFRPELDTAARRADGIKKWMARLARDEIRWEGSK